MMGNFAQNLVRANGTKATTVCAVQGIWIIALQKVTAVFCYGRNALNHLVIGLEGMLGQDNIAN